MHALNKLSAARATHAIQRLLGMDYTARLLHGRREILCWEGNLSYRVVASCDSWAEAFNAAKTAAKAVA
jgi:hypothetical protein